MSTRRATKIVATLGPASSDPALLDLLLLNRDNPRSLAWVLDTTRSRLRKLEQGDPDFAAQLFASLPDPSQWDLVTLSQPDSSGQHSSLLSLLKLCASSGMALSDALSQRHFSHADRDNRSTLA